MNSQECTDKQDKFPLLTIGVNNDCILKQNSSRVYFLHEQSNKQQAGNAQSSQKASFLNILRETIVRMLSNLLWRRIPEGTP